MKKSSFFYKFVYSAKNNHISKKSVLKIYQKKSKKYVMLHKDKKIAVELKVVSLFREKYLE